MSYYSEKILATSGLLSYWKLDELSGTTATDSKASATGTYSGATLAQTGLGGLGPAAQFSKTGTSKCVITSNPSTLVTSNWTWECWVYLTSLNTVDTFSALFTNGDVTAFGRYFRIVGASGIVEAGFQDAGNNTHGGSTAFTVSTGVWTHLAITYDTGTGALIAYKNGANATTLVTFNGVAPKSTVYEVSLAGRWNGADDWRLDGKKMHCAVYNAALSSATLLDHYNTGLADPGHPAPPTNRPLVATTRAGSW